MQSVIPQGLRRLFQAQEAPLRGKGFDRDGDFRQLAEHSVRVGTALGFVLHIAVRAER